MIEYGSTSADVLPHPEAAEIGINVSTSTATFRQLTQFINAPTTPNKTEHVGANRRKSKSVHFLRESIRKQLGAKSGKTRQYFIDRSV